MKEILPQMRAHRRATSQLNREFPAQAQRARTSCLHRSCADRDILQAQTNFVDQYIVHSMESSETSHTVFAQLNTIPDGGSSSQLLPTIRPVGGEQAWYLSRVLTLFPMYIFAGSPALQLLRRLPHLFCFPATEQILISTRSPFCRTAARGTERLYNPHHQIPSFFFIPFSKQSSSVAR